MRNEASPEIDRITDYIDGIEAIMETILTNIVLLGQIPAPTFQEHNRTAALLDRLAEFQVDECTTDGYQNPIGIIRGRSQTQPPIFVVAHLDTSFSADIDHNYTVTAEHLSGAGVLDNSIGVGVLASLPEIFRHLELAFQSDVVLAGVIQSIGKGNLRGIRHLLKTWSTPIRGAICVESADLGRLSHYSDGMIRGEVACDALSGPMERRRGDRQPNAILVLNEVIDQILALRFGIGRPTEHKLADVGDTFALSRERARQIEAGTLRKLRRTGSVQALRGLLDS